MSAQAQFDRRKEGLKRGLHQLSLEQLMRVKCYNKPMVLDEYNYKDGCYCPLAIGLGLDRIIKQPSHEVVYAILTMAGYTINNTRGIEGSFYTVNREQDLREALEEVILEKQMTA